MCFTPIIREMIHFDEHILQMGWNHQADYHLKIFLKVVIVPNSTFQSFMIQKNML